MTDTHRHTTKIKYGHVIKAIYETPWAILPATLAMILDIAHFRVEGGLLTDEEIQARLDAADHGPRAGSRGQKNSSTVAVIPVYGVISQRAGMMSRSSGGTSIEGLTADFREALADPQVDAIVFEIDSPGGSVDGVDEFAAEIRAARGQKPITAVANTMAASAAYWIAAAAREIVVTPSGVVGSIGVLAAHEDLSRASDMAGVKTTLISAGKYKTEGNEYEPLTDEARAAIQDQVDGYYGMFVSAVARGRGVPVDDIRAGYGEGRTVMAKPALAAGMVDRIDTLDATIKRVAREAASGQTAAWSEPSSISAGPIKGHSTDTSDAPWDGPAEEAKIANDAGQSVLVREYAWRDDAADPDTKAAYKFPHHFVSGGEPAAASTRGCSSGIAVLNGGRGGSSIPDGDREGVHSHLAKHLTDAGQDAPELALHTDHQLAAAGSAPSYLARVEAVTAEVDELLAEAAKRSRNRAREGRDLSPAHRERLVALRGSMDVLLEGPDRKPVGRSAVALRRLVELEAATRGYQLTD